MTEQKISSVNVIIHFGKTDFPNKNFKEFFFSPLTKVRLKSNCIYLLWDNINIFSIIKNRITINPESGLENSFIRYLLLGHGFAILLHLNNRLVFHANAVNIKDKGAIILLGKSGKGKSTTSLALHKQGNHLISDDVVSIGLNENYPTVYQGPPRLKLWPKVIRNINENPELMPKIHSNTQKRSYNISNNISSITEPLKAIYLIERGQNTKVKEISSIKALMELIKNSYCYKLFDGNELSKNLEQCSKLVNNVPVKILEINPTFEELNSIVKTIEKDVI
nr:hypothetical protein [uncultured Methanobacterium sp.]